MNAAWQKTSTRYLSYICVQKVSISMMIVARSVVFLILYCTFPSCLRICPRKVTQGSCSWRRVWLIRLPRQCSCLTNRSALVLVYGGSIFDKDLRIPKVSTSMRHKVGFFSGGSIPSSEPPPDHTNSSTRSPRQTTNRVIPKTVVKEAKGPQNGPLFSNILRDNAGRFFRHTKIV